MKAIGPSFDDEIRAAGLAGLPFSWGTDGAIEYGPAMTQAQRAQVAAVYAAHDPTRTSPSADAHTAEDTDRRAKLQQLDVATTDTATWTGLTAAQRQEAQRVSIRVVIAIAKRLLA